MKKLTVYEIYCNIEPQYSSHFTPLEHAAQETLGSTGSSFRIYYFVLYRATKRLRC